MFADAPESVDRGIASDQDQVYIEAALVYDDGGEADRIFTVSAREGGVWRSFKVTPTDVIGQGDAGK